MYDSSIVNRIGLLQIVSPHPQDLKCSIILPDTFCDVYSTSTSISYLLLEIKGKNKTMPQQSGRERVKDVCGVGGSLDSSKNQDGAVVLDHSCRSRGPGRLVCHSTD